MDAEAFLRPLQPYMAAFVERDVERRLVLLAEALTPSACIRGPSRVFTGHAEISAKIDGFQRNWPGCRLVLAGGLIPFEHTAHFPMAIVGPGGEVQASGHSVVELAPDGRVQRVLAYWGPHPPLPGHWPAKFQA